MQDQEQLTQSLIKLCHDYPKPEYWHDLIYRISNNPNFPQFLKLDAYRLQMATNALMNAEEYLDYALWALKSDYPSEAKKILQMGEQMGKLGQGEQKNNYEKIKKITEEDLLIEITKLIVCTK